MLMMGEVGEGRGRGEGQVEYSKKKHINGERWKDQHKTHKTYDEVELWKLSSKKKSIKMKAENR